MIQNFLQKRKNKKDLNNLLFKIQKIRENSNVLNIQAQPTGYSWLGVYNAGLGLFPHCTVAIPQYYSNQILTDEALTQLGRSIGNLKFEQLIYNGYNTYFSHISKAAIKENASLKVKLIYHGFFAELSGNTTQQRILKQIIDDIHAKKIHKIGFLKRGNAEVFEKIFGIPCQLIFNKNPELTEKFETQNRIGILTNQSFRKNTASQVIAALSLKKYSVSIFETDDYNVFDTDNKLIKLPHLAHKDFLDSLAKNLINSHVTFSEASGGQVFTESLSMGVPCLTSLTHGYLDDSEELKNALVVNRFDDAWAIAEKMEEIVADRERLSKLGLIYSKQMNQKANELMEKFMH